MIEYNTINKLYTHYITTKEVPKEAIR